MSALLCRDTPFSKSKHCAPSACTSKSTECDIVHTSSIVKHIAVKSAIKHKAVIGCIGLVRGYSVVKQLSQSRNQSVNRGTVVVFDIL